MTIETAFTIPDSLEAGDFHVSYHATEWGGSVDDDERHLQRWDLQLDLLDDEGDPIVKVGDATAFRVRHTRLAGSLWDLLDATSEDLSAVAEHVALGGEKFREHVMDGWEGREDFLVIDKVDVHPALRGRGLGHFLTAMALDRLGGGCGYAVLTPAPIGKPEGISRGQAVQKLTEHWQVFGFTSYAKDLMYLTLDDAETHEAIDQALRLPA